MFRNKAPQVGKKCDKKEVGSKTDSHKSGKRHKQTSDSLSQKGLGTNATHP